MWITAGQNMTKIMHDVPKEIEEAALVHVDEYKKWYEFSLLAPQEFWSQQARKFITWFSPWERVMSGSLKEANVRWFTGGTLNASYNCLDRHLADRGSQTAIIWEGDNPEELKTISYRELFDQVCRFANVLREYGVKKGDRVCIYLPMIP
jgi:acetyl-CoA synthetase